MPRRSRRQGGEVVGTTGIPLGTADMTPFLSKISGDFDGLFIIFFGKDAINIINQGYDLGLSRKYKIGRRRRRRGALEPAGPGQQDRRLHRHRPLHPGARGAARHALQQEFHEEAVKRLKAVAPVTTRCPTAMCNRISRR